MKSETQSRPGRLRAGFEIIGVIVALFATSALIGGLAVPYLPEKLQTPALALGLWGGVIAGAVFLRLSKSAYRAIGFRRPQSWTRTLLCAAAAVIVSSLGAGVIGHVIQTATDWPPLNVDYIRQSVEGNGLSYVLWLLLVVWGSAAFGEELLARGFILNRLEALFGRGGPGVFFAVLGQAAIFGALHAVQGPTGAVITGFVGVVFAVAYFASGRNLWASIIAHGTMDTISITMMYLGAPLGGYIN